MPRKWPVGPYAYLLCYPSGLPYYAGIGKGSRVATRNRNKWAVRIGDKIQRSGNCVLRLIVEVETRDEAVLLERQWILQYKRRCDGGLLVNITAGGDGGSSGRIWTAKMRRAVSAANTGRKWSDERRAAHSARMKGNKNLLGHKHSANTKRLISQASSGRVFDLSEEERDRRSDHMRRMNILTPPRKGQKCSSQHRENLSLARREQCT